jgi:hypothetical protein
MNDAVGKHKPTHQTIIAIEIDRLPETKVFDLAI